MKKRILLTVLMIAVIMGAMAQKSTLTLTFTADSNGQWVPLNSILIENLTQGGDTTLYFPDTVLIFNYQVGIDDITYIGKDNFYFSQNYPNPIEGSTNIDLYLSGNEEVLISVCNIMGRELIRREYLLTHGSHSFTFYAGNESLYFMTARVNQQYRTIKMFNTPSHSSLTGNCKLEYQGKSGTAEAHKSAGALSGFVFNLGDQLKYTASSALGDQTILDAPSGNQTYTFQYGSGGIPCPGMPTVTDIDGNVYNTVLIGSQCWMKENLKTTRYRNGTAILNVTDVYYWSNATTGLYVWYDNDDISWKDIYGALYNWHTTVDSNGLCPTGWHVPTHAEWTVLSDYIGGTGSPYGNELKSCRQVDSPLGGACNTNVHPRWDSDSSNWATDDYGFSAYPGGIRDNYLGNFYSIGYSGYWWSSTEYASFNAWYRYLNYFDGNLNQSNFRKENGFSVRCLRD